jgi:hypothetical protein
MALSFSTPAWAAATPVPGPTAAAAVTVDVLSGITITLTVDSFTLTGAPGVTAEDLAAVHMTVFTNNVNGYTVSVQPSTNYLAGPGPTPSVSASIPADALQVMGTAGSYVHLNSAAPVVVHQQTAGSDPAGDALTNDYQMLIPAVPAGAYTGTIDYVATPL